jgi:hypothetical protein
VTPSLWPIRYFDMVRPSEKEHSDSRELACTAQVCSPGSTLALTAWHARIGNLPSPDTQADTRADLWKNIAAMLDEMDERPGGSWARAWDQRGQSALARRKRRPRR